jgi:radical SAM protein with 4Fe4S-binding SPASM domain
MVRTQETPPENPERFKRIWAGKVDRIRIYEEHSRDGQFGSLSSSRGERKTCMMPFYEILVYDNGKVGRCNHDWDGEPVGDLNDASIKEIWNSQYYSRLRIQQQSLNITDQVCKDCDSWYPELGRQKTGDVVEK